MMLLSLAFLTITGCEDMSEKQNFLDDPELRALSDGINADLGLSKSSGDDLKDALNRHGKDGKHRKDPGFLWKVSAEMQGKLTDEEKQKMFRWMDDNSIIYLHGPDRKDHKGPRDDKGGMNLMIIYEFLDDTQKVSLKAIMDAHRNSMEDLKKKVDAGSLDKDDAKASIEALEATMKAEIDALLTAGQKLQIEAAEAEIKEKFEASRKAEINAMVEALGMTQSDLVILNQINTDHNSAEKVLFSSISKDSLKDSRDILKSQLTILMVDRNAKLNALFSDNQIEIINIHASLGMMFSRHCDRRKDGNWSGKGGKGGDVSTKG